MGGGVPWDKDQIIFGPERGQDNGLRLDCEVVFLSVSINCQLFLRQYFAYKTIHISGFRFQIESTSSTHIHNTLLFCPLVISRFG
jgi:hypothetical protein